jgi:putative MATE family efflux protein
MPARNHRSVLEMSLWALTWPIFVELVLSFTLGAEDSFYLARISDQAAAAVGALFPVFGLCFMVFQTFAQSGASVAAQLIGGGRPERARQAFLTMVVLNAGLGAAIALFFAGFAGDVGRWLGMSSEVAAPATAYLRLVGPMLFIQALRFAYASIINARGATRWNMLSAAFVNLANLGLDHVFTMGSWDLPRLGVVGIAYSTIAAQSLGLVGSAAVVHLRLEGRFDLSGLRSQVRASTGPILAIALPSVLEPLSFNLNQLVLVRIVVALGDLALATRAYTMTLIVFAWVWSFALGIGTQIKVAHQIGARRFDEADRQLHGSLRLGIVCGFSVMLLLGSAGASVYRLFTRDPGILALGTTLLWMGLALEPARSSNMIVGFSLRGSGDARFTSLVSIVLTWCVATPLAFLLGLRLELGLVGVWLAMIVDEASRGLMNYGRWRTGIWRTKGVLAREPV